MKSHKQGIITNNSKNKPTICLNMIVKNEAHIIIETLESIVNYIDTYLICDTGSTDSTKEVIKSFFDKNKITGNIIDEEWKNFGYNRTVAIQACKGKSDYIWVIDADDLVIGDFVYPSDMDSPCYELIFGTSEFTYNRTQIFNNKYNWRYVGVLHEYPECVNEDINPVTINGNYYIASRRLGSRNLVPDKLERDINILLKGSEEEPENSRYVFYLGQTYLEIGKNKEGISWYKKRISMSGWVEEIYFSYYQIGIAYSNLNQLRKANKFFMKAFDYSPERAEPIFKIIEYYRNKENYQRCYDLAKIGSNIKFPTHLNLFLNKDVYDWRIWDELSVSAHHLGKFDEAISIGKYLINSDINIPTYEFKRITDNLNFSIQKLDDTRIKKKLVFYLGYTELSLNVIYGSELAVFHIAERLTLYYDVYIVADSKGHEDIFGPEITYLTISDFRTFVQSENIEILIISRYINYFIEFPIVSNKTYIWLHDIAYGNGWENRYFPCDGKYLVKNIMEKINGIITLTSWHQDHILSKYEIPTNKMFIIGNGIDNSYFVNHDINKIKGRFIYTSDVCRGLEVLVKYFHVIHSLYPYTELYIYRGEKSFKDYPELMEEIVKTPYIHYKGKLKHKDLTIQFLKADIWLYPTSFEETFCISALEALRGGCYCISSKLAGLKDTIGDRGILIEGNIYEEIIQEMFINEVVKAFENDEMKKIIQRRAIKWASSQTWDNNVNQWINIFDQTLDISEMKGWLKIKDFDMIGNDITCASYLSETDIKRLASLHSNCVAFNTMGYLKYKININELTYVKGIDLYIKQDRDSITQL